MIERPQDFLKCGENYIQLEGVIWKILVCLGPHD